MKKILLSVAVISVAGVLAVNATTALFSDVEKSTGNTFMAGEIDLLVDSEQHYNGMVCKNMSTSEVPDYQWQPEVPGVVADYPVQGTACSGTWEETDLGGVTHQFFDFSDVKPGDNGENTISLHIKGNDAYMCAVIDNMQNNDKGCNEPEFKAETEKYGAGSETCNDPGVGEGELAEELHFFAWADMSPVAEVGNNIWEDGEPILFSNIAGPASDILDGVAYPIYTPTLGAMTGGDTTYIGMYWCLGTMAVDETNHELTCDGASATNITQSDSLSADITFYVEQARNNGGFTCPAPAGT